MCIGYLNNAFNSLRASMPGNVQRILEDIMHNNQTIRTHPQLHIVRRFDWHDLPMHHHNTHTT